MNINRLSRFRPNANKKLRFLFRTRDKGPETGAVRSATFEVRRKPLRRSVILVANDSPARSCRYGVALYL